MASTQVSFLLAGGMQVFKLKHIFGNVNKKTELTKPVGVSHPLPSLSTIWADLCGFREWAAYVMSQEKFVIFVVVDRFSIYAHFSILKHPYTTTSIA